MDNKRISWINAVTNDMHDEVASINEELVDGDISMAVGHAEDLIQKAKDLISNLKKKDEI